MKELLAEVTKSIKGLVVAMYNEVTYFMRNGKNKNL